MNFFGRVTLHGFTQVGIADSPDGFYHSQVVYGTERSQMTPFWRKKIYGFRRLPSVSEP